MRISRVSSRRPAMSKQSEEHARPTRPQEFVKVSRHAQPMIDGRDLGVAQGRHVGMQRIGDSGGALRWNRPRAKLRDGDVSARTRAGSNGHQSLAASAQASSAEAARRDMERAVAPSCFIGSLRRCLRGLGLRQSGITFVAIAVVGARTGALQCHFVVDLNGREAWVAVAE